MQAEPPTEKQAPNSGIKNEKPKKGESVKQDKIDSVFLAKQLILGDDLNLGKRLLQFKQIKNQNYDKFTDRCLQHLKKSGFEPSAIFDRFVAICQSADNDNTNGSQMGAIFAAFHNFWMTDVPDDKMVEKMFAFIQRVYSYIARKYVNCVRKLLSKIRADQEMYRKEALAMTNRLLKIGKTEDCKVLPLIYEFELYGEVPLRRIVDLVLSQPNPAETVYIFQTPTKEIRGSILKILVSSCANTQVKSDFSKCEHILRALEVDPFNFPQYITKLQQRYIAYIFRTYKLFYIELIISHDKDLMILLVEMIISQNRRKEADYFIYKYHLQREFGTNFSEQEKEKLKKIKNVLIDNDGFGPTEEEVLEEEGNFLKVADFGLTQNDIVVITTKNIAQINYIQQLKGNIGIDQQTSGGTHVFDPPKTSLLQLYAGTKIFILDLLELKNHQQLAALLKHMFQTCHLYGQDLQKEVTNLQKEFAVQVEEKVMQELTKNRLFDSGKMFKKVFPKETKSNLAYICERLWGKKLSKYEQCSGWTRRPLRLAQLHYAALDSVLPLKICEELQRMQKH